MDIFPGDRLEDCGGMMEPVDVEAKKGGKFVLVHKCLKCGEIAKVGVSDKDSKDELLKIAQKSAERKFDDLLR